MRFPVWGTSMVGASVVLGISGLGSGAEPTPEVDESDAVAAEDSMDDAWLDPALIDETEMYETEVRSHRVRRESTRHAIESEEIEKLPGTYGDPLNAVKDLPGVARTGGLGGGLIVRGSEPTDSVYLLDGSVVPMIYHFGDVASIVNSSLIEAVEFYPGNFSVRYGRTTAGIVDLKTRAPRENGIRAAVEADLFDAGAIVEGAVSPNWSLAVTGRRSYIDGVLNGTGLLEDELQFSTAPRYFDFQGMADYHPSGKTRIRLGVIGADDRVVSGKNALFGSETDLHASLYRAQAEGEHRLGKGVRNTWEAAFSYWAVEHLEWGDRREMLALPIYLRDELSLLSDKPLSLTVGLDTSLGWGRVKETYFDERRDPVEGDRFQVYPALYAELLMTALPTCELVYGVRVDYTGPIQEVTADPRFTGACSPFEHTTFKAGLGMFHQPPFLEEMDEDLGNPNLNSPYAVHYSVGIEQTLPMYDEVSVDAELFYKDLHRLVMWSDDLDDAFDMTPEGYVNSGEGRSYGLELKITHRPSKRFFGWIAYTLMKAERSDPNGDGMVPFNHDQRHILTILGNVTIGWGVSAGLRFRLSSGNPYTPVESVIYESDWDFYMPVFGEKNSARMPLFYKLDLRIDKTWQRRNVKVGLFIDIQNATNRENIESYAYNEAYSVRRSVKYLPIVPSLGLKLEYAK